MFMLDRQQLLIAGMTGRFLLALLMLIFSLVAQAATYGVSPLSVTFSGKQKSSVVTVVNEDSRPVMLRIKAMAWSQDGDGRDNYSDTNDLVFFPKRLELAPGEKRVIRVGINSPDAAAEKAYRLYVEELPPAVMTEDDSTKLSVLVTFGLPIFVVPEQADADLQLEHITTADGVLHLTVNNSGGRHARLSRIVLQDGTVLTDAIDGRYIFPGIRKQYSIAVPTAYCSGKTETLEIETEQGDLSASVVMPGDCGNS